MRKEERKKRHWDEKRKGKEKKRKMVRKGENVGRRKWKLNGKQ